MIALGSALLVTPGAATADQVKPRATLDDIDRVISQAPNLRSLLDNRSLWEQYYESLRSYYGDDEKFPKASFDAITKQLKLAIDKVPGLEERLWETSDLGESYEIRSKVQSSGRTLNIKRWNKLLQFWTDNLKKKLPDEKIEMSDIETLSRELDEAQAQFNRVAHLGTKSEQKTRAAQFYSQIRKDPRLEKAAVTMLLEYLQSENAQDLLRSNEPDLILDEINELRQNPGRISQLSLNPIIQSEIASLIPPKSKLLADQKTFSSLRIATHNGSAAAEAVGTEDIEFKPILRRLHGIWKGIPLNECVGGDPNGLNNLSPERWATVALKGTQFYSVENNGRYRGFVQMVPLSYQGKIYGSVDFGASILRNRAFRRNPKTGEAQRIPLHEVWLEEAIKHLPKRWEGLVVGESTAIGNAGVIDSVHDSAQLYLGTRIGDSKGFKHIDPMATKLTQVIPRKGLAEQYGGNMILDGTVQNAGMLTMIQPSTSNKEEVIRSLAQDPELLEKRLSVMANQPATRLIKHVAQDSAVTPKVQKWLIDLAENSNRFACDGDKSACNGEIRRAIREAFEAVKPTDAHVQYMLLNNTLLSGTLIRHGYPELYSEDIKNLNTPELQAVILENLRAPDPIIQRQAVRTAEKINFTNPEVFSVVSQRYLENGSYNELQAALSLSGNSNNPKVRNFIEEALRRELAHNDNPPIPLFIKAIERTAIDSPDIRRLIAQSFTVRAYLFHEEDRRLHILSKSGVQDPEVLKYLTYIKDKVNEGLARGDERIVIGTAFVPKDAAEELRNKLEKTIKIIRTHPKTCVEYIERVIREF